MNGLNGGQESENRVISLQTGFGGGKTHTLISLYHLASNPAVLDMPATSALKEAIGDVSFEKASVAVFTNTTNDPTQGRQTEDSYHLHTIWGELAYQLAGAEGYAIVQPNDEQRTSPKGLFKKVLEKAAPALILIDELADYCVAASGIGVGGSTLSDQTISFMQELTEAVAATDRCVLVATLPASEAEVANSEKAATILGSLSKRLGRVGADTKPVADEEIYEVIRRRLFEDAGEPDLRRQVVGKYMELYEQTADELPDNARRAEYRQKLEQSYPFHPELIDFFRIKWASYHNFQRTRGVLRLLASIVSDLWQRQQSLTGPQFLIHSGQVRFGHLDALRGQLTRLYGNGYDAVIQADIAGPDANAIRVDRKKPELGNYHLAEAIATTVLLGSFGSGGTNRGISMSELKLALLKPGGVNHNSINTALDELEQNAHYLYYNTSTVRRYWFHTKPNINILINQIRAEVTDQQLEAEIMNRTADVRGDHGALKVLHYRQGSDISEQTQPTLVILPPDCLYRSSGSDNHTNQRIADIATKRGSTERIYRNTLLFLLCTETGLDKLKRELRDYIACRKIQEDYRTQLEKEQLKEIKDRQDEADRQAGKALVSAYSTVARYSAKNGLRTHGMTETRSTLAQQIDQVLPGVLKTEEWLLDSVGLNTLRKNNLLPQPGKPVKVKDLYEAFLRFDDKPMVSGPAAVQNSLIRYCRDRQVAIAAGESPGQYTNMYLGEAPAYFSVTEDSYWLADPTEYRSPEAPAEGTVAGGPTCEYTPTGGGTYTPDQPPVTATPDSPGPMARPVQGITVSGRVPIENYTDLFGSFVLPFTSSGGFRIEVDVKFRISPTGTTEFTDNTQQYKNAKEAARQLGLHFDEE